MLVLTEIVDSITAIKCDADLLQSACFKVIANQRIKGKNPFDDEPDISEIAIDLVQIYANKLTPSQLLEMLTIALAAATISSTELDYSLGLAEAVMENFYEISSQMRSDRFSQEMSKNPDKMLKIVVKMLERNSNE